jgi:hypothetical protein
MKAIIIGSGAEVLARGEGKIIDGFDKVVRINKFKIQPPYSEYTGTKTDYIFCRKNNLYRFFESEEFQKEKIIKMYNNFLEIYKLKPSKKIEQAFYDNFFYEKKNLKFNKKIICIDSEIEEKYFSKDLIYLKPTVLTISDNMIKPHTTGYLAILFFKKYFKTHELYILGFDCFLKSFYYWGKDIDGIIPQKDIKSKKTNLYNTHPFLYEYLSIRKMLLNKEIKQF